MTPSTSAPSHWFILAAASALGAAHCAHGVEPDGPDFFNDRRGAGGNSTATTSSSGDNGARATSSNVGSSAASSTSTSGAGGFSAGAGGSAMGGSSASSSNTVGVGGGAAGTLRLQYQVGDSNPNDNQIRASFNLFNDGTSPVNLSAITVRYWFSVEPGTMTLQYNCDYAMLGCSALTSTFGMASGPGADHYLEIGFMAGTLSPGAATGPFQTRFHKTDYTTLDETNDYSYDPTKTSFADHIGVAAYESGVLSWGIEP